jgi:hypothetical protein
VIGRLRLTVPVLLAVAALEGEAHALGPIDLEAGAKVGVGTNPNSNGPNPYGFGLGVRGGVGIFSVYAGLSAVHYFGGSLELPPPIGAKVDYSSTLVGGELGYTITAIPLIDIRPQVGLGSANFSSTLSGTTTSESKLYIEPGLTVLVPLGLLFLGADANALIIPDVPAPGGGTKTYTSATLHGQIGIRL